MQILIGAFILSSVNELPDFQKFHTTGTKEATTQRRLPFDMGFELDYPALGTLLPLVMYAFNGEVIRLLYEFAGSKIQPE